MSRQLTPKQADIVLGRSGLFTVRACPGSGKTYTVAARLNRLLGDWKPRHQGIATISFTNIACQEIAGYLATEFGPVGPADVPPLPGNDRQLHQQVHLPAVWTPRDAMSQATNLVRAASRRP